MKDNYYVIVDLENLTYMRNGNPENIDNADKFDSIDAVEKELKDYDEDFNGAIYKIREHTSRQKKLIKYVKPEEN